MSDEATPMTVEIEANAPEALVQICGVSLLERLLRGMQRAGAREVFLRSKTPDAVAAELRKPARPRAELRVRMEEAPRDALVLSIPANALWDERLLRLLLAQSAPCCLTSNGQPTGARVSAGSYDSVENEIEIKKLPTYSRTMRRYLPLLWIPSPTTSDEPRVLDAAQKGSQDLPALVHAPIETFLVARLCKTSVTPNQLTALCNIVAWATATFFTTGHLVIGTICALTVGVLDGLDGKLARVKIETSEAGKLEHWFDTFYELAWAFALAFHFQRSGELPHAFLYLLLLLVAEGIDGLAKLDVIRRYGCLIDELTPLDRAIRLFGGRRNIYIWILALGLLFGSGASAFVLIAWWETITALIHVARVFWLRLTGFQLARHDENS